MATALAHAIALRAPWYVCERGEFDRFDPRSFRPALQKYDSSDFVERLLRDPTDSVKFDEVDDVWGYPCFVPVAERGPGRLRFATHRMVRPGPRKLFQPSHDRFYAVVIELFCDDPGLPRPGSAADGLEVGFVVRRQTLIINADTRTIRRMARDLTTQLVAAQQDRVARRLPDRDIDDVLLGQLADDACILPDGVKATTRTQAWMVGSGGHARWRDLGTPVPAGVVVRESQYPMWRLPVPEDGCKAAATRSLWFGLVPTYSSERADPFDDPGKKPEDRTDKGAPRFDEHAIYQVRCFARRRPAAGKEDCPPQVSWSDPTASYRLAPPFDPDGTKNHSVSITMPDFRAVAARAGQAPGPGGVTITSPPGSQMTFDPGNGSPTGGSVGGDVPRVCTFALEIFMIVAFFLFSMFLPIVMLLFQLWWMLALRFCLPPAVAAMNLLATHFQTVGDISKLPAQPQAGKAGEGHLDELLGGKGLTARLKLPESKFPLDAGPDVLATIDPDKAVKPVPGVPVDDEPRTDPLCRLDGQ
jgi:hypothetical protein